MRPVFVTLFCVALLSGAEQTLAADIKAFGGNPFAVGMVEVFEKQLPALPSSNGQLKWDSNRITSLFGQPVLYPVAKRVSQKNTAHEQSWQVYFLFKNVADVSLRLPSGKTATGVVVQDSRQFKLTLDEWWKLYQANAVSNAKLDRYPADVEQYLTMMLASRYGRKIPDVQGTSYLPRDSEWGFVAAITGAESLSLALQKDAYLKTGERVLVADRPLPKAVAPPAVKIPKVEGEVSIEPIANVVPYECFYVRFGSFANFLWARDRVVHWGTDFRDMASARSVDYKISDRLQHQLQLDDSELARILGPAVVRDVAAIGNDMFLREGAAVGVVFEAANNTVLSANIQLQRESCAGNENGVSLRAVTLAGHDKPVSLLSSPDNRVRSFYVVHGDFHLLTTSESVATRFLDVATDRDVSLGETEEFRYARHLNSVDRDDSAFIYLSDPFFRQVIEPGFRIEMARRAKSEAEIRLVQYAQLAAAAEGVDVASLDDLVRGKYLPASFLSRCDNSRLQLLDGKVVDSVRGAAGSFLPIADVKVTSATADELTAYQEFAAQYARVWRKMDPATIALNRTTEGDRERITMDLHVFPVPRQTYGFLAMFLSGKTSRRLKPTADCLALFEVNFVFGDPHTLFVGALDFDMPFEVDSTGRVQQDPKFSKQHPGFLGGSYDILSSWFNNRFDAPVGEYKEIKQGEFTVGYHGEKFALFGTSKKLVSHAYEMLEYETTERACQVRGHLGDFANSQAAKFAHALAWQQSREISTGNSQFLTRLATQFRIPTQQTIATAEQLLGGVPVCPFGGQFVRNRAEVSPVDQGPWASTKFVSIEDFRLLFLDHFHGAEVEFSIDRTTLTTRVELLLDTPLTTAQLDETANADAVGE